jgi:hypothetical protein
MIVRAEPSRTLLITQPDHAALAAVIMRGWSHGLSQSPRRAEILLAVEQHDNGWRELDAEPAFDPATGRILDFVTLPLPVRQGVWSRGVERLSGTPYAAALVAHHALVAYRGQRQNAEWAAFFDELTTLRDRHLASSDGATIEQLLHDYAYLRVADIASLRFCGAEINADTAEYGHALAVDGSHLTFDPDPFEGRTVELRISARELEASSFASADELTRAWRAAPVRTLTGTVAGPAATDRARGGVHVDTSRI